MQGADKTQQREALNIKRTRASREESHTLLPEQERGQISYVTGRAVTKVGALFELSDTKLHICVCGSMKQQTATVHSPVCWRGGRNSSMSACPRQSWQPRGCLALEMRRALFSWAQLAVALVLHCSGQRLMQLPGR